MKRQLHKRALVGANQRGVALIVVLLLVIVMGLVGLALIQLVQIDLAVVGNTKLAFRAQEVVEGGTIELLSNGLTQDELPMFDAPSWSYPNDESSFDRDNGNANLVHCDSSGSSCDYNAEVHLLRFVPLLESSSTWSRALIFEVDADSQVGNGMATRHVGVDVYKVIAFEPGYQLPNAHYR